MTSWGVGGDPFNGFFQGYGIGAWNHTGSGSIDDPVQLDAVVATARGKYSYFPLPFYTNSFTKGYAQFGSRRNGGKRAHAGVDLYAPVGTEVYSITTGKVQRISEFYRGSYAIEIDHYSYIGRYTELMPVAGLKPGAIVLPGQVIGNVMDLNLSNSMLHFEMYEGTVVGPLTNTSNLPYMRRSDLMDPTNFLLNLKIK